MGDPLKKPPAWADAFLSWFCQEELLEEIQGDLYELYEQRYDNNGVFLARFQFIWDVVRSFRLSTLRRFKIQNNNVMIGSYFKTGFRQLKAQKMTAVVNITGLAIAIGFAITVFVFNDHFTNMDRFHTHRDKIFQIINHVEGDDQTERWSDISWEVADLIGTMHPGVEYVSRIEYVTANIRQDEDVFRETLWLVDPDYMRMFDFDLMHGDRYVLDDNASMLITAEMASKYFGRTDVTGEILSVKFSDKIQRDFIIGGVMEKIPDRASFGGQMLISAKNFETIRSEPFDSWDHLTDGIFVKLRAGYDQEDTELVLQELVQRQNASATDFISRDYTLVPLEQLSVDHLDIRGAIAGGSHPAGRQALIVIAILLLLLACFNYVNISVSSAARRLKEIALRKVMGGQRAQLVRQFLTENLLITMFALVAGILLSYFLLLPGFSKILPINIPFEFSSVTAGLSFFLVLLISVALLSGAYPAFYISQFRPVSIFRGREKFGSSGWLSRILMVFQLLLAFTTIVACFVFNDNAYHMALKDWGYDPENVISIPVQDKNELSYLEAKANALPGVQNVSASSGHIGVSHPLVTFREGDLTLNSILFKADPAYPEMMGLRLIEGRWFKPGESQNTMIITRQVAQRMNLSQPLESSLTVDSTSYSIVGVVEDFNQDIFYIEKSPVVFIPGQRDEMNFLVIRTSDGSDVSVFGEMQEAWREIAPNDPFDAIYQAEVMDAFFRENLANQLVLGVISAIALILACIGLYGLISFQVSRRLREISVRKVLGANLSSLMKTVNRDYFIMLLIAMLTGMPLGYFLIRQLIVQIYPEPMPPTIWPFILATVITGAAILITLGSQVLRIMRQNPAESLRSD